MNRVGIYIRVSTQGQSSELQKTEILAFVASRGWAEAIIYEDCFTGTSLARPALRKLLKDVGERKLDIVICWKMDRLARSLRDLVSMLQNFSDVGVCFISLKDQIDMTTASGRLLTHLLAAFAEFEASLIRERVVAGLSNARRKGIKLGRPQKINQEAALALRQKGLSLSQIASKLGTTKSGVSKILKKVRMQTPENIG